RAPRRAGESLGAWRPATPPLPSVRRSRGPGPLRARTPGARVKRTYLSWLGRRQARVQARAGFPGNDWLAGITDPPYVTDPNFFVRWLTRVPGEVVELACHPGHYDPTLVGRDCTATDRRSERRVHELRLLSAPSFPAACARAGFTLVAPSFLGRMPARGQSRVA